MLDSAGQVVAGPRSRLATWSFLGRFIAGCFTMMTASFVDLITFSSKSYNAVAAPVARLAMGASHWRPQLTAEDVRVLEDLRIRSKNEGRPVVVASNHLSWTDITTIMAVVPEARFIAKRILQYVPLLGFILLGGRHTLIDRPKENAGEEGKQRAMRQVQNAGKQMTKYGVHTVFFLPGTRSKTGTLGAPKAGAAGLALDTNAFELVTSLRGTNEPMPISWSDFFGKGTGVHRRISISFKVIDPRDMRSDPEKTSKADLSKLTRQTQNDMSDLYLQDVAELRQAANRGDRMAQAQLAELLNTLRPGMEMVRRGQTQEAKAWAQGRGKIGLKRAFPKIWKKKDRMDEGMKTSVDFLVRFTQWWDGQG
jgi:1-acyl-sn-glycerol-3-phosphate acyltransferase